MTRTIWERNLENASIKTLRKIEQMFRDNRDNQWAEKIATYILKRQGK